MQTNNPSAYHHRNGGVSRLGLTLIELLVSLGVLTVVLLVFGEIISRSQLVVTGAQDLMNVTNVTSALSQQIRSDLAGLTTDGFLAIVSPQFDPKANSPNGAGAARPPGLFVTTVKPFNSQLNSNVRANSALVWYSLVADTAPPANNLSLTRRAMLLTAGESASLPPLPSPDVPADVLSEKSKFEYMSLEHVSLLDRAGLNDLLGYFVNSATGWSVNTQPSLDSLGSAWPIIVENASTVTIEWTKNQLDLEKIIWYGFEARWEPASRLWTVKKIVTEHKYPQDGFDELPDLSNNTTGLHEAVIPDAGGNAYKAYAAVWDASVPPQDWPTMLRVQVTLPVGANEETVEVICPIRRP